MIMTKSQRAGRVIAVDLGQRRVGISISDSARTIALPRPALENSEKLLADLRLLIEEEGATAVVIGHPVHLNGSRGPSAQSAAQFADQLRLLLDDLGIEVTMHDERLTTVSAARSLQEAGTTTRGQRERIDSASAVVLLESWLACQ